ncbi:glycosyltransferase [Pontibacter liquoris]|uniref:glycosyltransferase n=1 Tax=Pontibacter liquoris TaxID=2905677 RepID=UPI001FA786E6|nr:glycosyltransferase [Pontibacter liquoris]
MNIFVIPSWYPSEDYPISGNFIPEQLWALSRSYPDLNIGVSLWGQKDKACLLWANEPLQSIAKIIRAARTPVTIKKANNFREYVKPAFTWSRKILNGNKRNILRANLYNLRAFERDYGPVDLIHAHCEDPAGYFAMKLAHRVQKPYCITEHMGPFPSCYTTNKHGKLTDEHLLPYTLASPNIAVSPFLSAEMERHNIRTVVVPNFIDENIFKPHSKSRQPGQTFTFFTLADIRTLKGIDHLLYAIKLLADDVPAMAFRIGGDGPQLKQYKALALQLGLTEKVTWLGEISREKAVEEFQNCDAFVLPSLYESMGIVYIEALACGKPIIATRCGGPESTVTLQNGLLVAKNNPEELAQAIRQLALNYNSYDSKVIRQDFLNRFSATAVLPRLVELYQHIIENHKAKP